ncbi:MAG: geranylgeranylglycerol-phosphate geranylgeranyltransferase [Lewinellaceae bacterium]|nr:geranylgeranylglycerol-phosphate geranylgeranyltransferase [Lewinellaceae bacterium]
MIRALSIFRLFRLPNLFIVFLTQWIPYWLILRPAILKSGAIPMLTTRTFSLLAITTVMTTLGGYLINDYFDKDKDAINRPDQVIAGRLLPEEVVLYLYWLVQTIITLLSLRLFFAFPAPRPFWPLWVFPAVSGSLFLYTWALKCTPVMGNIMVAFLCAVVPVLLLIPEDRALWLGSFQDPERIHQATGLVWLYAVFAFFTNLWREQVKDLEDFPGDAACKCMTLAVVKGPRSARVPAALTGLAASLLIVMLLYFWKATEAPAWQITAGILCLLLPALIASAVLFRANRKKHFTLVSTLIKWVMFAGILLLIRQWPDVVLQFSAQG